MVPLDYEFYGNGAERMKWEKAQEWVVKELGQNAEGRVLEPFGGVGVFSMIYSSLGFHVTAIEENRILYCCLTPNLFNNTRNRVYCADNMTILPSICQDDPYIKIIDLDPYSSCVSQIKEASRILKNGLLFVTAGDIYAGSRFKNWGFVKKRYGVNFSGPAEKYAEKVIYPFVQSEFAKYGKATELIDLFTYKTICRLCVRVK